MTIQEALPDTKKWWPSCDIRTKLNCLLGRVPKPGEADKTRLLLSASPLPPHPRIQKCIVDECRRSNLVWVGLHKVASLQPDEIEELYTRRWSWEGWEAQMFGQLISSGYSGISLVRPQKHLPKWDQGFVSLLMFGGAEDALHRLGVPLKAVVAVEISPGNWSLLRYWREETEQAGFLVEMDDARQVEIRLFSEQGWRVWSSCWGESHATMSQVLIGLAGRHSSLFYEFWRILYCVRDIMARACRKTQGIWWHYRFSPFHREKF